MKIEAILQEFPNAKVSVHHGGYYEGPAMRVHHNPEFYTVRIDDLGGYFGHARHRQLGSAVRLARFALIEAMKREDRVAAN